MRKPKVLHFAINHGAPTVFLSDGSIWELAIDNFDPKARWREVKAHNERPYRSETREST